MNDKPGEHKITLTDAEGRYNPADSRPADDMILLPRSVVERLVDPVEVTFVYIGDDLAWCRYCAALWAPPEPIEHAPDCPVRIVQALLAQSST